MLILEFKGRYPLLGTADSVYVCKSGYARFLLLRWIKSLTEIHKLRKHFSRYELL